MMKGQIHKGRGNIFHCLEPHVIGRRRQHVFQQVARHRRAGFGVGGKIAQHFGHIQPMLIKLTRQFDKIARHRRA